MRDSIAERKLQLNLSRRELLMRAGWTAAGLAAVGLAHADAPPQKVIVGSGSETYQCFHDWLVPPDDILWGETQGVAQDVHGNIYITHTVGANSVKKDAIVVFDRHGKFLKSWGSRFAGGGHGIDIRKEGNQEFAYHCDTAHRQVVKTTLDGEVLWEKNTPLETGVYQKDTPFVPTNVAFAPNGDFYVADGYGSNWIMQYNIKGEFIRVFGGTGTDPGKFRTAHGIWLDTRGKEPVLVITDRSNSRIQNFTLDGKYVSLSTDGMRQPCFFSIRGEDMVVPDLKSVVTILDKDNKVAAQLGDGAGMPELRGHPRQDFVPGKFIHPHAAKYLHNGDILVVEWVPIGRITLLKKMRA